MNNKHFIWVTLLLLVIGFLVDFISGLEIPKYIEFKVEPETQNTLKYMSDINLNIAVEQNSQCNISKSLDILDVYHIKRIDCFDRYCKDGICFEPPTYDTLCSAVFRDMVQLN